MNAPDIGVILITLGGLFLLGLVADIVGRNSFLPRVTLLSFAGFVVGPVATRAILVVTGEARGNGRTHASKG
jgi:hypothetical protein